MSIFMSWKRRIYWGSVFGLCGLAAYAGFVPAPGRGPGPQEMPGPLSASHVPKPGETDCAACHVAKDRIAPAKCLGCHQEIASRIAANRGYHRDKAEDCAACHGEHQGRQADIVPLDRKTFDHSETGAVLRGAHLKPKNCDKCHTTANTLPRTTGRSYLLKDSSCRGCHAPMHPGRQDQCLDCHTQESWMVERRGARD